MITASFIINTKLYRVLFHSVENKIHLSALAEPLGPCELTLTEEEFIELENSDVFKGINVPKQNKNGTYTIPLTAEEANIYQKNIAVLTDNHPAKSTAQNITITPGILCICFVDTSIKYGPSIIIVVGSFSGYSCCCLHILL